MSQLDVTIALVSHTEQEKQELFHSHLEDSVTSIDNHYITQMVKCHFFFLIIDVSNSDSFSYSLWQDYTARHFNCDF